MDEDPPVPHVIPEHFKEEEDEPDMLAPQGPETEEAHEEDGTPVLNRFLPLRIVYGDGLRQMRKEFCRRAGHDVCQVGDQERYRKSTARTLPSHLHLFLLSLP